MINVPSLFRDLSTRQDVANWQPLLCQLDDLFDPDRRPEASFAPPCDVAESDAHYQFTFDVPGLKKEELDIEVAGRRLTVSGERKFELKKDTARAHFVDVVNQLSAFFIELQKCEHVDLDMLFVRGILVGFGPLAEIIEVNHGGVGRRNPGIAPAGAEPDRTLIGSIEGPAHALYPCSSSSVSPRIISRIV